MTVAPPNGFARGSRLKDGSILPTAGTEQITLSISEAGGGVGGLGGLDLVRAGRVYFGLIPEPTTAVLLGGGLVGLGVMRRGRGGARPSG